MLKNEIIEIGGRRWLVKQAVSREAALDAIASARCSGSIGQTDIVDKTLIGGAKEILAEVVQINSDGTERRPYTDAY